MQSFNKHDISKLKKKFLKKSWKFLQKHDQIIFTNVTKITRLAIPRFWPNACAPWKTGFSHQVRSQGCSKWSSFSWKILSTLVLMTSLDGKNRFFTWFTWKHHSAPIQWKIPCSCRKSQPCNLSNVVPNCKMDKARERKRLKNKQF